MKINELVKNDRVLLSYGAQNGDIVNCANLNKALSIPSYSPWEADVVSKPRGKQPTIVCLKVYGYDTEIGDTYAHKILAVKRDGEWVPIELEPKQMEMKALVEGMGM